jgi:hypothetical protein
VSEDEAYEITLLFVCVCLYVCRPGKFLLVLASTDILGLKSRGLMAIFEYLTTLRVVVLLAVSASVFLSVYLPPFFSMR